jgi:hypothetical protein
MAEDARCVHGELMKMELIEQLAARAEIQDCLYRYARGVDRRDWTAVRATYHPDAWDEHGEFTGTVDQFIDWVSERHATIPFAAHFVVNCLIEFIDDRSAVVETYFLGMQRRAAPEHMRRHDGDEVDAELMVRYVDLFEKRQDNVWRVARRKLVYDSSRIQPSSHTPRKVIIGTRDENDPIFAVRRALGLTGRSTQER